MNVSGLVATVSVSHPSDLQIGDRLQLGKRPYKYAGRTEDFPDIAYHQNEYVFEADHPEPGALGARRVFSQSELEDLITAGFLARLMHVRLELKSAVGPQPRPF